VGATLQKDDDPVSICLILDVSSSMKLNGPAVLEASRRLIANRNPSDEVEIVSFNGPIVMIQGFTTDAGQLEAAFQRLQFRGHSNLFDAVSGSMDKLKKYVPRFRPVFVIISDGDDNFSQSTLPDLVQKAMSWDAPTIYSLCLLTQQPSVLFREGYVGEKNLDALAMATGGLRLGPEKPDALQDEATALALDIHGGYRLEYTSTHAQRDGKPHTIEIRPRLATDMSKVKMTYRQRYYAPSR